MKRAVQILILCKGYMKFWRKKYTMITEINAKLITRAVRESVIDLDGDLVEVGVSIGDSAEVICEAKGNRILHLFDTFTGHPKGWIGKYDLDQQEGKHAADIEAVKKRLNRFQNVFFHKGIFPETAKIIQDGKFCFVNLDTDLYKGTYEGLKFFVPRMVRGGVIIVHDATNIPGVACAIVDFFGKSKIKAKNILLVAGGNQAVIQL